MIQYASSILKLGGAIADRQGTMGALRANATLADVEAESIMAAAEFNAQQQERSGSKFVSRQIAAYAKAGVKFEGSPATVVADTYRALSLDKAITHQNYVNQAIAKGWEANNLRLQARFEKSKQWGDVSNSLLSIGSQMGANAASK